MENNKLNTFTGKFISQIRKENPYGSILFSPLCLASVFLWLHTGAKTMARAEIGWLFGFDDKKWRAKIFEKYQRINKNKLQTPLCRIFIDKSFVVLPNYLEKIGRENIKRVQFQKSPEEALDDINQWAYHGSSGEMAECLGAEEIDYQTSMAAISLSIFKEELKRWFPLTEVVKRDFHAIYEVEEAEYFVATDLLLPYKEIRDLDGVIFGLNDHPDYTFFIFLPTKVDGWLHAEHHFWQNKELDDVFHGKIKKQQVDYLLIPKWTMEQKLERLKDVFYDMGITHIFSEETGLKGISYRKSVTVNHLIHSTKFTIDDSVENESSKEKHIKWKLNSGPSLIVNRPFLYFIVDKADGTIILHGTQTSMK